MSTEIYYFSGTGNSLHIANELKKRIPDIKLIPMVSLLNKDVIKTEGESVGFVFPVYLMSVPPLVKKFLKRLDLSSVDYIFAVLTRINISSLAGIQLEKAMHKKRKKLNFSFVLNMASNSSVGLLPPAIPGVKERAMDWVNQITKEKISEMESVVQKRLDLIQKVIINKEKNPEKKKTNLLNKILKPLIFLLTSPIDHFIENNKTVIPYYADSSCTGCGICEKVCLSKKIVMDGKKPFWQKNIQCYFCYACFNFCPEQAILIKDSYIEKKGRYFYPSITANDIAGQKIS